jgi:seryl-tRNA(Sec) selenium transferase
LTCLSDVESQIEIMADILINDKSRSVNIFYRQLRVGKIHIYALEIKIENFDQGQKSQITLFLHHSNKNF